MTNDVLNNETAETHTTSSNDLSNPSITFADYQKLRRGEKVEVSAKSAPETKDSHVQKSAANSEHAEKEVENEHELEASEDDGSNETDDSKDKTKKKGGFQRRIDKLNARVTEKERELDYWKNMALEKSKAGVEPKSEKKVEAKQTSDGEPNPESFESHADYLKAITKWTVQQESKASKQNEEKQKLQADYERVKKEHFERVKAFSEKTKDFKEMMGNLDEVPNSPHLENILFTSENGPELLYELAKNPEEADRIARLHPIDMARALGRIESKLVSASSEENKPETKKITSAPKPIAPVGKGGGSVAKSIDDPNIPFTEYVRLRREQIKRSGR
jgi:hypothetical protein